MRKWRIAYIIPAETSNSQVVVQCCESIVLVFQSQFNAPIRIVVKINPEKVLSIQ
jgi:hypothetical protein